MSKLGREVHIQKVKDPKSECNSLISSSFIRCLLALYSTFPHNILKVCKEKKRGFKFLKDSCNRTLFSDSLKIKLENRLSVFELIFLNPPEK